MKVAVVFGTRPELIKVAPLIQELRKREIDYIAIHSGQHSMDNLIEDLKIGHHINLGLELSQKERGILGTAVQTLLWTQRAKNKIRSTLKKNKVTHVLYHGDTLTCLAACLASKRFISGHIEAGIRTYNWRNPFPEENIRRIVDKRTNYAFAPTDGAVENLKREKVKAKIILTGNTIVDAVYRYSESNTKKKGKPIVFIHRQENVQSREGLKRVIELLKNLGNVIYLEHPTTVQKLKNVGLYNEYRTLDVERHGFYNYVEFLNVLSNCPYIITDSGGIQEETSILKIPCIVWRKTSEREEAVEAGNTVLVGNDVEKAIRYVKDIENKGIFYEKVKNTKNPFGDGKASKRIVDVMVKE